MLGAWLLGAPGHPMHTSVSEIIQEADGRSVRIGLRLFADDLAKTLGPTPDGAGSDSLISAYVRGRLVLTNAAGSPVRLIWDKAEREGDVVQVGLRAVMSPGLAGAQIFNSVLCERFDDQVNVVRATYGGRTTTLIFIRGDPAKRLR